MEVEEALRFLGRMAKEDPSVREKLLATRDEDCPAAAFCRLAADLGVKIYEMDLISAGEDAYAAMKRSTNGGGENSPRLAASDDYYELFIAELENLRNMV